MKIKQQFVCEDGAVFDDIGEAEDHEKFLAFEKHLASIWRHGIECEDVAQWLWGSYNVDRKDPE